MQVFFLAALVATAHAQSTKITTNTVLSGAGTTNPQNYFRTVMEYLTMESKIPVKAVYRAVGSSTGYKEFIGGVMTADKLMADNKEVAKGASMPYNDFGAGDIPIPKSYYDAALANNDQRKIMQVPLFLGAIAIFYNNDNGKVGQLKLDGCLLAEIFSGKIKTWQDPKIKNFNIDVVLPQGDIIVVHRRFGSSSTSGTTQYLKQVSKDLECTNQWPLQMNGEKSVGSTVGKDGVWFGGNRDVAAQGSSGVLNTVRLTKGAIGYLDAAQGQNDAALGEVQLLNAAGAYVLSSDLKTTGGLELVAEYAVAKNIFKTEYTSDWSDVALLNLGKDDTYEKSKREKFWPITMVTYLYIDPDQTQSNGVWYGLWKFFIDYIATSEEGQSLATHSEFGFTKLPKQVLDKNKEQILKYVKGPGDATVWIQEKYDATQALKGAGDYVISGKRQSNAFAKRVKLSEAIGKSFGLKTDPKEGGLIKELQSLDTTIKALQKANKDLVDRVDKLQQQVDENSKQSVKGDDVSGYHGVHSPRFDFETTLALLLSIAALWTAMQH